MSDGSREPPGAGRSYPIKRSRLDGALQESGATIVHEVTFLRGHVSKVDRTGLLLDAIHSGPESWAPGKVVVRIFSVPSSERHELEKLMLSEGLPLLCNWLLDAESAPETWRNATHRFVISVHQGKVVGRTWSPAGLPDVGLPSAIETKS